MCSIPFWKGQMSRHWWITHQVQQQNKKSMTILHKPTAATEKSRCLKYAAYSWQISWNNPPVTWFCLRQALAFSTQHPFLYPAKKNPFQSFSFKTNLTLTRIVTLCCISQFCWFTHFYSIFITHWILTSTSTANEQCLKQRPPPPKKLPLKVNNNRYISHWKGNKIWLQEITITLCILMQDRLLTIHEKFSILIVRKLKIWDNSIMLTSKTSLSPSRSRPVLTSTVEGKVISSAPCETVRRSWQTWHGSLR